jgi:hypothetical protein
MFRVLAVTQASWPVDVYILFGIGAPDEISFVYQIGAKAMDETLSMVMLKRNVDLKQRYWVGRKG